MRWIPFPFIRIVLFLIAGILLGIYHPDLVSLSLATWIGITLLILFLIIAIFFRRSSEVIRGGTALITVFVGGYICSVNHDQSRNKGHVLHIQGNVDFFSVRLSNQPAHGTKTIKAEGEIDRVMIMGTWRSGEGKIQLLFSKSDSSVFRYGDVLIIKGSPQLVKGPSNPGEFDYKRYLGFRNIYHQRFVSSDDFRIVRRNSGYLIFEWSYAARSWGDNVLRENLKEKQEYAIATALILGVTDELDWSTLNAYSSTGVLHVLSVSGLHVGIVYMILLFLFKPLENYKAGKWILAIASILILWAYAFITGLSPSVLRSVTMFSVVAFSRPINQRSDIYNTLSVSALILLLYDPFMIMSVGFQLSYLALLGIVFFQPRIYQLWEPEAVWLDKVWEVSSVSLAAQLITFPVSLLYFHQFPTYFLFANLVVIPASFVVLVGGLALLAFQFIAPLAHILGMVLGFIIKCMNMFIVAVESMPFSTINNISINLIQYWLLMGVLGAIVLMFKFRQFSYVMIVLLFVAVFSSIQWINHSNLFEQNKLTVYNIPHHTAIDFFDHGKAHYLLDSVLCCDLKKISYSISPNRITHGISNLEDLTAQSFTKTISGARIILWKKKYILQIVNSAFKVPLNLPAFDYCIVSNNAVNDLVTIQHKLKFKKLIIDSSNSYHVAEHLLKGCQINRIEVYSVAHSGAYEEII